MFKSHMNRNDLLTRQSEVFSVSVGMVTIYFQCSHSASCFILDNLRYMPAARYGSRDRAAAFSTEFGSVRKIYREAAVPGAHTGIGHHVHLTK